MEDGIHTYDIYKEGVSTQKVGTKEFAEAVIANLGQTPQTLKKVELKNSGIISIPRHIRKPKAKKDLVGVDVFVHWEGTNPELIAEKLQKMNTSVLQLNMITNRGVKVWPNGFEETFCTDHWRCRFYATQGSVPTKNDIIQVLTNALAVEIDTIKTENLYNFDGERGYSLGQGQ
jgi:isocitrate dehydrogenase